MATDTPDVKVKLAPLSLLFSLEQLFGLELNGYPLNPSFIDPTGEALQMSTEQNLQSSLQSS